MGLYKEKYKGYAIWQDTKSKDCRNKISGHEWTEDTPINKYYIVGLGVSCLKQFGTIKGCKKHIDFLIRNNLNIDYYNSKVK